MTPSAELIDRLRRSDERIELGYRLMMDAVKTLDAELALRKALQEELAEASR